MCWWSRLTPRNAFLSERRILQICHGYDGPFLDCARQYAVLFEGTSYKVTTVYLTGRPKNDVVEGSASEEVIFLDYDSREVRGLKLAAIREIRRIAAARDFALCIAHRSKPAYVALLGTRLTVINVHHAFGDYARRSRRAFSNFFRERLLLLGVSNAVRDDIRRCLPTWEADRIQTLYNRLDVDAVQAEHVSREGAREALGLPQDSWIIGNVGRLHPDKDQATLIRGFAAARGHLPHGSILVIVGTGRLEAELKTLAETAGVGPSVYFLGQVAEARRLFKAFDIFVLSSDHEPFGMVLLEAMAAGVPIVSADCGGAPEVLESCAGFFRLGDERALSEVLINRSQQGPGALAAQRESMAKALRLRFSDTAARQRFWSMEDVVAILGKTAADGI